ncbi:MAG: ribonuclease P protein component [Candidatus Magasanikbacteria bacterium]|nr:ribonuclease P protein component [Candidatus Magasanikbacteria bacterium]
MLQQINRLAKIRDFNLLVKHGRFINGSFLSLKTLHLIDIKKYFPLKEDPDKFEAQLRIAFAVSTKISKSAVKRNRFRRQLREAIRLLIKETKIDNGWYLLFIAKPGCLDNTYEDIKNQAVELLSRTKALK